MDDLGSRLKRAREERGVQLKDIAVRTKISAAALEALERNDFTRLPGGIFGRAFVRAYALEIGLDPDSTVTAFQVRLEESEREAAERTPRVEITSDDREFLERQRKAIRVLRFAVVIVVVAAVVLVGWGMRSLWSGPAPAAAAEMAAP
jgi:cytoskeletal protein RodZ